jgi:pimeloyl-ACP methyl ester carboxylesterase
VALDLALHRPESVLALALLEAGPMGLSPVYESWFESLRATLEELAAEDRTDAIGEAVLRDVFGAWEELPAVYRDVFTANGPSLLAEVRGGERTDNARLGTLSVRTLVVTAEDSPEPLRDGSEALLRALPHAQGVRVAGGHGIDPADPTVLALVAEVIDVQSARTS